MKVIDLTCTKCGSSLQVSYEEGMTTAYCQYCGQKILLDPEALEVNVHHSGTIRHENINRTEDETKGMIVALAGFFLIMLLLIGIIMLLVPHI